MNDDDEVLGSGHDPLFSLPGEDEEDPLLGEDPIDPDEEEEEEYI